MSTEQAFRPFRFQREGDGVMGSVHTWHQDHVVVRWADGTDCKVDRNALDPANSGVVIQVAQSGRVTTPSNRAHSARAAHEYVHSARTGDAALSQVIEQGIRSRAVREALGDRYDANAPLTGFDRQRIRARLENAPRIEMSEEDKALVRRNLDPARRAFTPDRNAFKALVNAHVAKLLAPPMKRT